MLKNFRKVAQSATSVSPLMAGREKITTQEITGKTLTVAAFDIARLANFVVNQATGEVRDVEYAVFVFSEMPNHYYQAGTVGTRIVNDWLALYDGESDDIHEQCAELSAEIAPEKIQLRFTETKTRRNQNIVKIDVL